MSYNTLRQVTSREVTWQSKLYNIDEQYGVEDSVV